MGCYAPYAEYCVESVGERNVDKIPAQQGSYLNKEARNWMEKKTRAYPGFGGSVHVTCIRIGSKWATKSQFAAPTHNCEDDYVHMLSDWKTWATSDIFF